MFSWCKRYWSKDPEDSELVQACRLLQAHCSLEESSLILASGRYHILRKAKEISDRLEHEKDVHSLGQE
jgi:hypothetical protein